MVSYHGGIRTKLSCADCKPAGSSNETYLPEKPTYPLKNQWLEDEIAF